MAGGSRPTRARKWIERLLQDADVRLDGKRPCDIIVRDERLFDRVARFGTLGLGEAYMEGWWDSPSLDQMFTRAIRAKLEGRVGMNLANFILTARHRLFNMQSRSRAPMVARRHYDFGNPMFEAMLGPTMNYSCAWWSGLDEVKKKKAGVRATARARRRIRRQRMLAGEGREGGLPQNVRGPYRELDNAGAPGTPAPVTPRDPHALPGCYPVGHLAEMLDAAQKAKMDLICRKLGLMPGMTVLDIGCGWGGLARYMARNCGCNVTAISISRNQIEWARTRGDDWPGDDAERLKDPDYIAPGSIKWLLGDYRDLTGSFDRIVSVGMFEHVGRKNYRTYFRKARKLIKPDGLFLLHTIGTLAMRAGCDPWISRYIFPNGQLPSMDAITKALAGLFVVEDWHNLGADYDPTLMAWHERFENGLLRGDFRLTDYEARMFRYYLLSCAAAFRARDIEVWQIILSPEGVPGGYDAVR